MRRRVRSAKTASCENVDRVDANYREKLGDETGAAIGEDESVGDDQAGKGQRQGDEEHQDGAQRMPRPATDAARRHESDQERKDRRNGRSEYDRAAQRRPRTSSIAEDARKGLSRHSANASSRHHAPSGTRKKNTSSAAPGRGEHEEGLCGTHGGKPIARRRIRDCNSPVMCGRPSGSGRSKSQTPEVGRAPGSLRRFPRKSAEREKGRSEINSRLPPWPNRCRSLSSWRPPSARRAAAPAARAAACRRRRPAA